MLYEYDSLADYAAAARTCPDHRETDEWVDNLSMQGACAQAVAGNEKYVPAAQKIIDKLDVALPELLAYRTIKSPFGGRVNWSDWQSGSPTPMRRRAKRNSDVAPIKIVVSITCSAGIDQEKIEARGAAILAFLLKAQQMRPIDLYILVEIMGATEGWNYYYVRQESRPLHLGQTAFALCSAAVSRQMGFGLGDKDGFNGAWPNGYEREGGRYAAKRRERLGLTDKDIVIGELHLDDPLLTNPIAWITTRLNALSESEAV